MLITSERIKWFLEEDVVTWSREWTGPSRAMTDECFHSVLESVRFLLRDGRAGSWRAAGHIPNVL